MLSRVSDTRVFASSEDVVFMTSSRWAHAQAHRCTDEELQGAGDEQLQRPTRLFERAAVDDQQSSMEQACVQSGGGRDDWETGTMELVFLASGAIRAREGCLVGSRRLKLPQGITSSKRTGPDDHDREGNESDGRWDRYRDRKEIQERPSRLWTSSRLRRRAPVEIWRSTESSWSSVSGGSEEEEGAAASEEEEKKKKEEFFSDADSCSIVSESFANSATRKEETARVVGRIPPKRRESRRGDIYDELQEGAAGFAARSTGNLTLTRSSRSNNDLGRENNDVIAGLDEKGILGEDICRELRQQRRQVAPEQVSSVSQVNDAPSLRTEKPWTVGGGRLVLDERIVDVKSKTLSNEGNSNDVIDRLEQELKREKKRVAEQTTHLLEVQGRNQQLRARIKELEAQLATEDSTMSTEVRKASREHEDQRQLSVKEHQSAQFSGLNEHDRLDEVDIPCLSDDTIQQSNESKQLEEGERSLPSDHAKTVLGLRGKLDDMTCRLSEFLAKVECWKSMSKRKVLNCGKTELPVLVESVWSDFPLYSDLLQRRHTETLGSPVDKPMLGPDQQTDLIVFLKKRLRQREDELRQTRVKYVELKELCARQCVREADLQNFINEHRLRGNLPVIRKTASCQPGLTSNDQEQAQDEHLDEARRLICSKAIRKNAVIEKYSDHCDDSSDCMQEAEEPYAVRTLNKHELPENSEIALEVATGQKRETRKQKLLQQQKQQRQQQRVGRLAVSSSSRTNRVPLSMIKAARRHKSIQQLSRSHLPLLGKCPMSCGSHASYLQKEPPAVAAQSKPDVATTGLKRAVGAHRPWM
uniref:Uncharacterized protein n=1 Tax=Peronospora matthiolae TaxID=2874970 RepID=A0AAV1UNU1_9STRA